MFPNKCFLSSLNFSPRPAHKQLNYAEFRKLIYFQLRYLRTFSISIGSLPTWANLLIFRRIPELTAKITSLSSFTGERASEKQGQGEQQVGIATVTRDSNQSAAQAVRKLVS